MIGSDVECIGVHPKERRERWWHDWCASCAVQLVANEKARLDGM